MLFRSHFAGLMEMSVAAAAALALSRAGAAGRPRSLRDLADDLSRFALRAGPIAFFVLIMCSALILGTPASAIGQGDSAATNL